MAKQSISTEKIKFLDDLLYLYKAEIDVIYAIDISWPKLSDAAKDKCEEDFEQAFIARETLLEELHQLKDAEIKVGAFEAKLADVDHTLLQYSKVVKDMYGLDVKSYLNIKTPKGLLKSGK
jgi:hypothetical protein